MTEITAEWGILVGPQSEQEMLASPTSCPVRVFEYGTGTLIALMGISTNDGTVSMSVPEERKFPTIEFAMDWLVSQAERQNPSEQP